MSGHSKWATTKHKKAGIDAKRSKVFTKVAKLITIAARDGKSGDPMMNPSLRMAVENARAVSMPKDNIDRAIKRGIGGGADSVRIEEIVYEAYGPGGAAIIIECLTDNKNRALGEIKTILTKNHGSLANSGSVSYLFKKVGQIIIDLAKNKLSIDDLEMVIIDSGAEDFSIEDGLCVVTCTLNDLNLVKKNLDDANVIIDTAEPSYSADTYVDVPEEKKPSVERIIDLLDDLDDVNNVYANANL